MRNNLSGVNKREPLLAEQPAIYVAQESDLLGGLARRLKVYKRVLRELNPGIKEELNEGMHIKIPWNKAALQLAKDGKIRLEEIPLVVLDPRPQEKIEGDDGITPSMGVRRLPIPVELKTDESDYQTILSKQEKGPVVFQEIRPLDVLLVGYETHENLGLRYLAAVLIQHGYSVQIQSYLPWQKEEVLGRIQATHPRIVGSSLIFQYMAQDFKELITYLRERGVTAHFTIGGHYPSFQYDDLLDTIPGLDSVVRFEGEFTLLELVEKIDRSRAWKSIPGVAYRKKGTAVSNPLRPLIHNLDLLPAPYRDIPPFSYRGIVYAPIISSRSCVGRCSFCSIRRFYEIPPGKLRRVHSPKNIVATIEYLYRRYGGRFFIFQDDDFFAISNKSKERALTIAQMLIDRGLADKIRWRISCRPDEVDVETFSLLKEAGLAFVYLGIESGNEQGLVTINKRFSLEVNYQAVERLKQIGLFYDFGFMMFDPDSTLESIRQNIQFLRDITLDGSVIAGFCRLLPYAGTPIAARLKDEGRLIGTASCPNYHFLNPQLDVLYDFFELALHHRNFTAEGHVDRFRMAKLDMFIFEEFYSSICDAEGFKRSIRDLTIQSNRLALDTLEKALEFIALRNIEQIKRERAFLEELIAYERTREDQITAMLDESIKQYEAPLPVSLRVMQS